jgi:hypothetical protein
MVDKRGDRGANRGMRASVGILARRCPVRHPGVDRVPIARGFPVADW